MKRLLLLSALALFLTTSSWAYDFSAVNDDGKTIYYNILSSSERTCQVTYWSTGYKSYSGSVVVPPTVNYNNTTYVVTSIDSYAFQDCTNLTQVTIPESVTGMGTRAFENCSGLTEVNFNATSCAGTPFGHYLNRAFYGCSNISTFNFGENVTKIPSYLCYSLKNLTEITIPNSVTEISSSAFYGCAGLTSLTLGNSVTTIGESAFSGCSGLTEITIPNSVTSISSYAFEGCSGLTEITIPNSVTYLSGFEDCTGLTQVTIPNSVITIGNWAFSGCAGLTQVIIGNNVTSIGNYAFANSGLESISIPSSVTTIGDDAFDSCEGLTSVVIGESVTSIGNYAFWFCTNLSDVTVLNPEPPSCSSYTFGYVDTNTCSLTVPKGSKEAYSTAYVWKDFYNIIEADLSPVESILANGNAVAIGYYTLDGKEVGAPHRGINTIRYSDGTAKKVLVK